MKAQRSGKAHPVLDRKIPKVGRLKRTYGTSDRATIAGINVMLTQLQRTGQYHIIEALQAGHTSLLQVYAKWSRQDLKSLTTVEGVTEFGQAALAWVASHPLKDATRVVYLNCLNQLMREKKQFTVADLPSVLKTYKVRKELLTHCRMFNQVRNICKSFLSSSYGNQNPVYQQVQAIKPLTVIPKRPDTAWSVKEFYAVVEKLKPDVGAHFETMALTGVGLTEHRAGLAIEGDGIRIMGEKVSDGRRNRLTLKVKPPAPYSLTASKFQVAIKKASGGKMTPYDGRRSFARWALEAGIPFDRVAQYMGHKPKSMTERYARSQIHQWLKDDSLKLAKYIEAQRSQRKA